MTKNIIVYIIIILTGLICRVISVLIYPLVFLFRRKVLVWCNKRFYEDENRMFQMKNGYKKWKLYFHPYFWFFCFTTGLTDKWHGPEWYLKELKLKIFDTDPIEAIDISLLDKYYRYFSLKEKLVYFYLCFRWQALRNSHWALSEWFFREGKWIDGSQEVVYAPKNIPWWDIMPNAKFKDADGTFRDNSGPYVRYPFEVSNISEEWLTTHTGKKLIKFKTYKGKKRFYYGYCKIIPLKFLHKFLVIEQLFGWNWWNGIIVLHNKYMFKKMDELSISDYNKYLKFLNENYENKS